MASPRIARVLYRGFIASRHFRSEKNQRKLKKNENRIKLIFSNRSNIVGFPAVDAESAPMPGESKGETRIETGRRDAVRDRYRRSCRRRRSSRSVERKRRGALPSDWNGSSRSPSPGAAIASSYSDARRRWPKIFTRRSSELIFRRTRQTQVVTHGKTGKLLNRRRRTKFHWPEATAASLDSRVIAPSPWTPPD